MTKPVLLAVDDDADVLSAVSRDLRKRYGAQYRVLKASSADDALDLLGQVRDSGASVALVLSDQRMPGMDGTEFLSATKKEHPRAKRILLTAYADISAAVSAINESEVHYYLLKPWDPPEEKLFPVLDDMLDEWRAGYRPGYGGVRIIGDRWSARGHSLRDFLARNQVPYTFLDVEQSAEARDLVDAAEAESLPLVVLPGGERLERPDIAALATHIGLETRAREEFYDLAIVGAGPAGLAAAVYGGSEGLRTVLFEREAPGGQAGTSSRIENYLGFPTGLSGSDLARRAVTQARRFGVEILTPQEVADVRVDGPYKRLALADGSEIGCHVLVLAMGVSWKLLPARDADRFIGAGVYYGAAMSEAILAKDRVVYIVGAGNSAGQAAMYFREHAAKVVMLVRGDSLGAKMSHYLVRRLEAADDVEIRLCTEVVRCLGSNRLESLQVRSAETGTSETVPAEFLFAFLGAAPRTEWLRDTVACDERGFVLTGADLDPATHLKEWPLDRAPYMLETNVPGIFACGDARHDSVKRVASAVGEGSIAVSLVHQILAER
jgi:thioredoxin reductase (NADPH)